MKVLFATNNSKKLKELKTLIGDVPVHVLTPEEVGVDLNVVEDGKTFVENAAKKASAFARASDLWTLADDSGLCVDALEGRPGVRSARYAEGTDKVRYEKLLRELEPVPDERRTARFMCVLCLASPRGDVQFEEGSCEGLIVRNPKGQGGFGYDPVFFLPSLGRTMAELSESEKNAVSHRAVAFRRMRPRLEALASSR
jgi:XTP/dITP diphosphohydrolase